MVARVLLGSFALLLRCCELLDHRDPGSNLAWVARSLFHLPQGSDFSVFTISVFSNLKNDQCELR